MVETPYFTKETVDKEKGIIAEEIKMYQEQPSYKIMFNTLRAMYDTHPIKVDIAGSVDSIYKTSANAVNKSSSSFSNNLCSKK